MPKKIIICPECEGEGLIQHSELTDYHKRMYDTWDEKCTECKGSGRLLETTEVDTIPFKRRKIEKR